MNFVERGAEIWEFMRTFEKRTFRRVFLSYKTGLLATQLLRLHHVGSDP